MVGYSHSTGDSEALPWWPVFNRSVDISPQHYQPPSLQRLLLAWLCGKHGTDNDQS